MKNKILYIVIAVLFSFCFMNYSIGEETDFNKAIQQTSMPTDAEIMETIRKFNFDKNQEEYLFKETKKKLNEMYSNKSFAPIFQGASTLNMDDLQTQSTVDLTKTINSENYETKNSTKTKKYSNHPPLVNKRN